MEEVDVGEVWRAPVVTAVDDGALCDGALNEGGQGVERLGKGWMRGEGTLNLEGAQGLTFADEKVDFVACGIAVKEGFGKGLTEGEGFEKLDDDDVFEESAKGRMSFGLGGVGNAEECGCKAWLGEVDLRCTDEASAKVGVVGTEAKDDVGGLEDSEPLIKGVGGDADVVGQGTKVEELTHTSGKEAHEGEEAALFTQVDEATDVAFDVGLVVGLVEA